MILWTKHFSDAHHETRVIRWSTLHLHANNTHWHSSLASIVFASMTVFEMLRNQIGMIFWQVPSFIEVCWTRQAAIAKKLTQSIGKSFIGSCSSIPLWYWTIGRIPGQNGERWSCWSNHCGRLCHCSWLPWCHLYVVRCANSKHREYTIQKSFCAANRRRATFQSRWI